MPNDLVDVAPMGAAHQSSLGPRSRPEGAQALVSGLDLDCSIATEIEDGPWWQIDLPWPIPVASIQIENCPGQAARLAMARLTVEISQDGAVWTIVHAGYHHFGDGRESGRLTVALARQLTARHVRLSLPERRALELRSLRILALPRDLALAKTWLGIGLHWHEKSPIHAGPFGRYALRQVQDDVSLVGFRITPVGRFGNTVLQLCYAVHLAERLGVATVIAPDYCIAAEPAAIEADGITVLPSGADAPPGQYLVGDFYYRERLGRAHYADLTGDRMREIVQRHVKPFLGIAPFNRDLAASRARELAVHIRSGDIFGDKPHPLYVQPPLSFYTTVVGDLVAADKVDSVCIVAEDRRNPCIDALERNLVARRIPVRMQSGTLDEDIACLRHARHVVYGFGTFGYAVSLMAEEIETLHYFSDRPHDYADLSNVRQQRRYAAPPGSYISIGDWACRPDQLQLMLDYPAEKLLRTWDASE
jgi:hypothetical protein